MSKLVALNRQYWPQGGYGHWCAGCGYGHEINVDEPNSSGAKWSFNNDPRKPTFSPSINIRWGKFCDPGYAIEPGEVDHSGVCHYFIRDGRIQYLADCTHNLRGYTIDLPEIPVDKYLSCQRL